LFLFKWVLITAALHFMGLTIDESAILGLIVTAIDWLIEGKKEIVVVQEKK